MRLITFQLNQLIIVYDKPYLIYNKRHMDNATITVEPAFSGHLLSSQ